MASTLNADNGVVSGSAGLKSSADSTGVLALQTNGTTAVTISTTQQVGIGTTSPSAPLAIGRVNSAEEGGQLDLCRASDNASSWGIDVFGSTSTPSLRFIDNVASATRMLIDGSGNVGIGTSSPQARLHANAAVNTTSLLLTPNNAASAADYTQLGFGVGYATPTVYGGIRTAFVNPASTTAVSMQFFTDIGGSNYAERMRIDSSGNLLVGTTSNTSFSARLCMSYNSGTTNWAVGPWVSTPTNFYISGNGLTNGVYLNGVTATSWSGLSDERAKDIIEPISNAVSKVNSLRAVIGKYKTDEEGIRRSFLIAQDVQAVLPEAVSIANPETQYLGVAYTDVIPLLVAAIKEQQALINNLTERLTALEGAQA